MVSSRPYITYVTLFDQPTLPLLVPPPYLHLMTSPSPQQRTISRAERSNLWPSPTLDWPRSLSPRSLKEEDQEERIVGMTGLECSGNGVSKWMAQTKTTLMMVSRTLHLAAWLDLSSTTSNNYCHAFLHHVSPLTTVHTCVYSSFSLAIMKPIYTLAVNKGIVLCSAWGCVLS